MFHAAGRRAGEELPGARIRMTDRFPEPRLARPGWYIGVGIAIGIAAGIAMVFISVLLSPLAERMRGAPG